MGHLAGHDQKQIYIKRKLVAMSAFLAKQQGVPFYRFVNAALRDKIDRELTAKQRKLFASILTGKEKTRGQRKRT